LNKVANSLNDIKEYITDFENKVERKGIWYRGVTNSDYKLIPSLQRDLPPKTLHDDMKNIERKMFDIFKNTKEIKDMSFTDWELMYLMQHLGLRTRFLDWTFNPLVALFFATYNWNKKQNARLWLLDPHLLNKIYLGEEIIIQPKQENSYFDFLDTYTINNDIYALDHYQFNYDGFNKRIEAQSGVFTLHLSRNMLSPNIYSLDNTLETAATINKHKYSDLPTSDIVLNYIDIHPNAANEIEQYLFEKDISIKTLFPDLHGTVDYINNIFPNF